MPSTVTKRSVVISGHKTSISLEEPFWLAVRAIAEKRQLSVSDLLREIERNRDNANLSSAIRIFVLDQFRRQAEAAHLRPPNRAAASPLPPSAAGPD